MEKTALDYAKTLGYMDIVKYLESIRYNPELLRKLCGKITGQKEVDNLCKRNYYIK